ncbi:unnamed protein product [Paramecium octaurelia]|uniref:Uncharacterized protein n=1 Tax=Paramecium octaurelia TaxID=43137 RepID=A0A8S1YNS8_PAROT|nr:unnamed protein product [Paramecium octaurelia]
MVNTFYMFEKQFSSKKNFNFYLVNCSAISSEFYAQSEYDIDTLMLNFIRLGMLQVQACRQARSGKRSYQQVLPKEEHDTSIMKRFCIQVTVTLLLSRQLHMLNI